MFHVVVGDTRNDFILPRCEDELFGVSIDLTTLLLLLLQTIKVFENSLHICLVLEKHLTLDCLSKGVHAIKTHLLIMVIQTILIQVLNQYLTILDVVVDLVTVVITVISKG